MSWITVNAPDDVIAYVAKLVQERDTAVEEYGELEILAAGYNKAATKLGDAIKAISDVTLGCSACQHCVRAVQLGLVKSL